MPLDLNTEEIDSLDLNAQATGSTLKKLLMHYNEDLGDNDKGAKIYSEINSKEALERQLPRIKYQSQSIGESKKNLLVLNVNALDKSFSGDKDHYVGIVIEPTFPTYSVQYIDPLGGEINPIIKESIDNFLTGGAEITQYRGGLQYNKAERDSRSILVYLMSKAAHNQELPVLPDVEDKVKESKAIGRRLKRKYKSDNGKEIGASTDLVNLKLDDLRVLPRVDEVAEGASADAGAKEADDWVLRDDLSPLLIRKSYNPDVISRRLDSIARLITGGDICAAVAFDGQNILYSNNSGKPNAISERVFSLLSKIAQGGTTIEMISENKQLNDEMNAIAKIAAEQIVESKRSRGAANKKAELKQELENKLLKDIKKVVASLAIDSDPSKKFPEELVQAFRDHKRFEFVAGKTSTHELSGGKPVSVHAEMAMLDRVVSKDGIEVYDRNVVAGRKPFYIGLTMLCCKDCRNAVVAYNEVSAEESKVGIADDSLFQAVGVRGEHLQQYNNWTSPDFFERRPAIAGKYQEIKKRGQKYNPGGGKVLADDSNSEPEIDDVKSRKLAKTSAIATSPVLKASSASRLSTASHTVSSEMFRMNTESYVDPSDIGRFSPTTSVNVGQQGKKRKIEKI